MGPFNNTRVQIRISGNSEKHRNKIHICTCKKSSCFRFRDKRIIAKKSCRICSHQRYSKRFLQYLFPRSKENRGHASSNKFETPQQVSQETTFQNGFSFNSSQSSETRRLGNKFRSERCLSTYSNFQKPQKIPSILSEGRLCFPIQGSTIRPNLSTKNIHKSGSCDSSSFTINGHKTSSLSRRLVSSQSEKIDANFRSRTSSQPPCQTGLYNKLEKVKSNTMSDKYLHWGTVSVRSRYYQLQREYQNF